MSCSIGRIHDCLVDFHFRIERNRLIELCPTTEAAGC
jgi:hypothetical protein